MLTADYFLPAKRVCHSYFESSKNSKRELHYKKTDDIYNTQIFIHSFLTKVQ